MKKIIAFMGCLWALCAGATNITNYPLTNNWSSAEWFLLSGVAAQTNWNIPGNYVVSSYVLNSTSNTLYQITTNLVGNSVTNVLLLEQPSSTIHGLLDIVVPGDDDRIPIDTDISGTQPWSNYFTTVVEVRKKLSIITNNIFQVYSNAYFYYTNYVYEEYATNLTVLQGLTNLTLTPNTILKADANDRITSVANGTGALTNNNSGVFGWFTYASLQDITNTVNSYTNVFMSNTNTIFTNATVLVEQIDYLTNAAGGMVIVDFAKGYQACTTNAAFEFGDPLNVDSTKKRVQTAVIRVDNSTGPTPIAVTAKASVHVVPGSVMWITNSTYFTWSYYAPDQTNLYAVPIY